MYAIYDTVAQIFNSPFVDLNDGSAMRGFKEGVKDQAHKNDFVLYKIGEYTDHDGKVTPSKEPERLMTGFDIKEDEYPSIVKDQAS